MFFRIRDAVRAAFLLAVSTLLAGAAPAQTDFAKVEVKAEKLAEGVYMLVGAGGNIGVSAGADGVFVIDDQYAPLTEKILAAIRQISDKPVRFVLNTHFHGDHTGGNRNLGKAGSLIVAHDNVRKRLAAEQVNEFFKSTTPPSPKEALPVVTFTDAVTFHLNGDEIHAFHVPPAHTDGDAVVVFRGANVIHAGDLFFNGLYPFIDLSGGGSVEGMIGAADRIGAVCRENTKLIPGHGPVGTCADLKAFREMLAGSWAAVTKLVAEGKTKDEAVAARPTAAWDEAWGKAFIKPEAWVGILWADADAKLHPKPPKSRAERVVDTIHGVAVADPYRWLEDPKSPETRAWIEAENRYADALLSAVPGRAALVRRFTELTRVDTKGTPFERGGRTFYTSRRKDQELSVLCVRTGPGGKEEVLVDPHPLSPDRTVSATFVDVSDDGRLVAWGKRQGGEDEVVVSLLEVDSKSTLPDLFPRARYTGFAITSDKRSIWYGRQTEKGPRVFHHAIGTDPATDALVFGEGYGPGEIIGVDTSENGRWLTLTVSYGSSGKTEIWTKDLSKDAPVLPLVRGVDAQFFGTFGGDALYVRTNWKAPNGRIVRIDPSRPDPAAWKEIVPEGPAAIQALSLAGGKLFVRDLSDVVSRVRIFDPSGRPLGTLSLPGPGTVSEISGRWGSPEAFYSFSSFNVPNAIYRYDAAGGRAWEWWRAEVPLDASALEVKQVFFTSKDGTRIPMFLVFRKGLALDGTAPALLTGYGGFRVSLTPQFSARAVIFAEHGGVYAVANLRGGGEYGEPWHRAGMLAKKQNVFDDFIAAAEWLVANRYASPSRLAISGGSNGGLLVGAALTQHPELFRAVICAVPLLDMVRYDRFKVAKFWVPEYGSAEDPDQFRVLYAYSPYHHVKDGVRYPAVMFVSGDSDTRVDPLHARKMAALMQQQAASVKDARPVLLHYDTKSGHSRGKSISQTVEDTADELQFLAWQLGMTPRA